MNEINIQGRQPKTKKRIDKRLKTIKNPYYTNEYIWKFDGVYIKIRANISEENDYWETNVYDGYNELKNNEIKTQFKDDTIDEAIKSAERYTDRCNLTVEEYVIPA